VVSPRTLRLRNTPGITALLCTRNRPRFVEFALRFFRWQTFPFKRLIIVDDSDEPLRLPNCEYVRLQRHTPLGEKLNIAAERASTPWLWKMDDDDFYAPQFLQTMASARHQTRVVYFLQPFLFFDVESWTIRHSDPDRCSGATFLFSRQCWLRHGFRGASAVDAQFLIDHIRECGPDSLRPVEALRQFLQLRHRTHLWTHMPNGQTVSAYLQGCSVYPEPISALCPQVVTDFYAGLRRDMVAGNRTLCS
jgi:glycosyltransferase involved in cell wall biosynthesis